MQLLSLEEVADRLSLAAGSVRRMLDSGEFIQPIQLTPRRIAFDAAELDAWLASRPRGKLPISASLAAGIGRPA